MLLSVCIRRVECKTKIAGSATFVEDLTFLCKNPCRWGRNKNNSAAVFGQEP